MLRLAAMRTIPLAAVIALAIAPAGAAAHTRVHDPKHRLGAGTSGNWSGYSVDGTNATFVTATWIQPAATNCSTVPNSWSSPWVGIDGDNSNTVEQIGTDSDCSHGAPTYYAWWEMYPKKVVTIPAITVHPGDAITGSVAYGAAGFTLTLTDVSTGQSYTTVQASKKVARTSVEWIMEGPSSGNLTDFGSVGFTNASATIGNQTVFPGSGNANQITMVTGQGAVRAAPSLAATNAFGVTWQHS